MFTTYIAKIAILQKKYLNFAKLLRQTQLFQCKFSSNISFFEKKKKIQFDFMQLHIRDLNNVFEIIV